MVLAIFQANVANDKGDVQGAASIEVRRESDNTLATIYSNRAGTTPLANPFDAEADGYFSFFAAGATGPYKVTATKGAFSKEWRYVAVGLLGELDFIPQAFASVQSRAQLKALPSSETSTCLLNEGNRSGLFALRAGDYSAEITADTQEGIYIKADAVDADQGAWVRVGAFQGPMSLHWFGGVGDKSTDNEAALEGAHAVGLLNSRGYYLDIPEGTYNFDDVPGLTMPASRFSITITGHGNDATILNFPNANNGLTILQNSRHNSIHLRDFACTTEQSGGGYNAVVVDQQQLLGTYSQNDFVRIACYGDGGGAGANYWDIGLHTIGLSNVNLEGSLFYGGTGNTGIGFLPEGNDSLTFNYGVVFNVDKCGFYNLAEGIQYGDFIQGMTIDQTNIVNCVDGIRLPAGHTGATQLAVSNSNIDVTRYPILLGSNIVGVNLSNLSIYSDSARYGIYIVSGTTFRMTVTNCGFNSSSLTGSNGIRVETAGACDNCVIMGNTFSGYNAGINLNNNATNTIVALNRYPGCNSTAVNTTGTGNAIGAITV